MILMLNGERIGHEHERVYVINKQQRAARRNMLRQAKRECCFGMIRVCLHVCVCEHTGP